MNPLQSLANGISKLRDRLFESRPPHELHIKPDKNGDWRWHIVDPAGRRLTLMSSSSQRSFANVLRQAQAVADAEFEIVIHRHRPEEAGDDNAEGNDQRAGRRTSGEP